MSEVRRGIFLWEAGSAVFVGGSSRAPHQGLLEGSTLGHRAGSCVVKPRSPALGSARCRRARRVPGSTVSLRRYRRLLVGSCKSS